MLAAMAKCGKKRVDSHACRNLHNLVSRKGPRLPVKVSTVQMRKRISRRKLNEIPMAHPVLKLSDWAATVFKSGGHFFMRGQSMDSASEFSLELRDFWGKYSKNEPQHPFFEKVPNPDHWGEYIPVMIHGDEGRGRQKQPVLVIAYQPVLPLKEEKSNMKKLLGHIYSNWVYFEHPNCMIRLNHSWFSHSYAVPT